MTLITGLDHILVEAPTDCEDSARHFFGTVLGLTELQKPEPLRARGGAWFLLPDGRQIHVGVTPDFTPRRKGHLALRCQSLSAVQERLQAHGIATHPDQEAGVPRLFLADPWGNRMEIVEGAMVALSK